MGGVGRYVTRGINEFKYKEPCYYRITKVEPAMDKSNDLGSVWAEELSRGRSLGEIQIKTSHLRLKDWMLIHKHDEAEYLKPVHIPEVITAADMPLPPLLRDMVLKEQKKRGVPTSEPRMKVTPAYSSYYTKDEAEYKLVRTATSGETPHYTHQLGIGETTAKRLYQE